MKKYIVIRKGLSHLAENQSENGKNEFWNNEDYHTYKEKNGLHFSDKLAEWASKKMKNANRSDHIWSINDIKESFTTLGYKLLSNYTWGDATYAANMIYSDYAQLLKIDTDAVKMAYALLTDPDGYEGMIFNRYTADIMEKGECIPWKDLI